MKLGFVSAILPDLSLEEVLQFAAEEGFSCVELMCWPKGRAERRYAGVTHVDVARFNKTDAERVADLTAATGVEISGLGYYPNPLVPDRREAKVYSDHLKRVIRAAERLGISSNIRRQTAGLWARFLPPGHSSPVKSIGQFSIPIRTPWASANRTSGFHTWRNRGQAGSPSAAGCRHHGRWVVFDEFARFCNCRGSRGQRPGRGAQRQPLWYDYGAAAWRVWAFLRR